MNAKKLIDRISCTVLGTEFTVLLEEDHIYKHPETGKGRPYLVATYVADDTHTKERKVWRGRKWYLSQYMTNDEIVKTAFAAIKAAVEHEVMEGFRMDGKLLFNPHTPYTHLMLASQFEVRREPQQE